MTETSAEASLNEESAAVAEAALPSEVAALLLSVGVPTARTGAAELGSGAAFASQPATAAEAPLRALPGKGAKTTSAASARVAASTAAAIAASDLPLQQQQPDQQHLHCSLKAHQMILCPSTHDGALAVSAAALLQLLLLLLLLVALQSMTAGGLTASHSGRCRYSLCFVAAPSLSRVTRCLEELSRQPAAEL